MMNNISITTSSAAVDLGPFLNVPYAVEDLYLSAPAITTNAVGGFIPFSYDRREPKLLPGILKITHPNNTTVVHWADDTTTSVRLMPGETYDKYAAFCACVVKKIYGNTTRAKKICDKYDFEAMQAKEREKREKEEEKLRAKAKRRLKERIKRRARELYIEEEARKLAAANAFKADK